MCLGVPARLVERLPPEGGLDMSLVDFGGLRRRVCTACVPDAAPGDYVIVHAGIAISQVDPDEAARVLHLLEQMGELSNELSPADGASPEVISPDRGPAEVRHEVR